MNDKVINDLLKEIYSEKSYELRTNFRRIEDEISYQSSISYLLHDLKLIKQPFNNRGILQLTPFGLEVMKKGGWQNYNHLKKNEEKEVEKNRKAKELAELENLSSNTKLNNWLLKTKTLPHILSIISILVAIAVGYFTIQSDIEKQQLEKRIQELEKSNKSIAEEQYIQDDLLTNKFFSELNTFKKDSRFIITKEPVNNRHVDNLVDTVLNFKFDKINISSYKATSEEFIFEANIRNAEFAFLKNIKIGIKKKDFENNLNTKISSDIVKIGNLEQTSVFVFSFKNNLLKEIVYEGYLD